MLRLIQSHLEAIYRIEAPDVTDFQIDADQLAEVMGEGLRSADEWVLVREQEDGLDLAVFVSDDHLSALAAVGDLQAAARDVHRRLLWRGGHVCGADGGPRGAARCAAARGRARRL